MITNEKIHSINIFILCTYLLILPIDAALGNILGDISLINYIAFIYVIMRVLYICLCERKINIKGIKRNKFIYIYLVYSLLSTLWRGSSDINTWYIISLITASTVSVLAITDKYTETDAKKIKNSMFYSVLSIIIAYIFLADYSSENGRLVFNSSKTMDPNYFAICLSIIVAILFNNIIRNKKKIISLIFISVVFFVIILTGSRSGLITNIVTIIISFVFTKTKRTKKIAIVAFLILISFILVVNMDKILPENIFQRFSIEYTKNDGGAGRINIWKAGIETFKNASILREFFGTGFGTFQYVVTKYHKVAHNVYIQILVEQGIIGIFIFLSAIIKALLYAIKEKKYIELAAISGLLIGSLAIDINITRTFWICLLLIYVDFNLEQVKNIK